MRHVPHPALPRACRRHVEWFLSGNYERLYAGAVGHRGEVEHLVHLSADRSKWWALLKPITNRSGTVLWSNFLRPGSTVRSKFAWDYARRRRQPDTLDTMVNPRWLAACRVPANPLPLRKLPSLPPVCRGRVS